MGALNRKAFLGAAAAGTGELLVRSPIALASPPGPAGGAASVVDDHLQVNVRATGPGQVRARVWPTDSPTAAIVTPWYPTNASNAAQISVPDATMRTAWSWQGEVQDSLGLSTPVADVVRTASSWPAAGTHSAFTFAFGACIIHTLPAPAMSHVHDHHPKFFAIIGDMDYVDLNTVQNYALYSKWFTNWFKRPEIAPMVGAHPIIGVQDDHDYGLDECWADTIKPYAAQAFADLVPGAPYPATTYRSWSIGDVDFWLLDCRRYKDPKLSQGGAFENGQWMSVIRSAQRTWLLNGLAASQARVKVILSPISFSCDWWWQEQQVIRSWVNHYVKGTVMFCTGDRHATAFVRNSSAPRIWEMLACPINNNVKHPISATLPGLLWAENPGGRAISNAVGIVEVDTASAVPTVTLRAITDSGATLHAVTVNV
jgi:PhoD-like phosphatase